MGQTHDWNDGHEVVNEGFCPACAQPRVDGIILHQPHCPYDYIDHDQPDEEL